MTQIEQSVAQAMAMALELIQVELLALREAMADPATPVDCRDQMLQWVNDLYLRVDLILALPQGNN